MVRTTFFTIVALTVLTTVAVTSAHAQDVYVNGVKVNGLRNQKFTNAEVQFDANGNVRITAKGVKVQVTGKGNNTGSAVGRTTGGLAKRYFLVSDKSNPGSTQYNIDVHINGKFVTRIKSTDNQTAVDITKHLVRGKNKIIFTAIKKLDSPRKSFSPAEYFKLMIGEGQRNGNQIVLERTLVEYKKTAADVSNDSYEKSINAE